MMRKEVRCPACDKMLFAIIDNRYIEIKCTRNSCVNKHHILIYDLKEKDLTRKSFKGKIELS